MPEQLRSAAVAAAGARIAVLAVLPFFAPRMFLGIALLGVAASMTFYAVRAYRRVPRARGFLVCTATGHALHALIALDFLAGGGRSGALSASVVMVQATLYFAAAFLLLRARRAGGEAVGLADGFAAFAGLVVVQWQWLALADGATPESVITGTVLFICVAALTVILSIFWGVARDPAQDRRLLITCSTAGLLLAGGVLISASFSVVEMAAQGVACHLVGAYLLTRFYASPSFDRMFEPEPPRRRLVSMQWMGPACALAATPVLTLLFYVRGEVPELQVGLAGAALTGVAFWRGSRLFAERERNRRELVAEQRFRALVEHGADVILIADAQLRVVYVSGGTGTTSGLGSTEMQGAPLHSIFSAEDLGCLLTALETLTEEGDSMSLDRDFCLRTAEGERRWVGIHVTNRHASPAIGGWVLNLHDVTDRKTAEQSLALLAHYDNLTGLPNRVSARAHLQESLSSDPGGTVLLFCDLDGFKAVNDTLGHDSGDEVLRAVAGRWSQCLRATDLLGRWGGDEFLVVCSGTDGDDDAQAIAERLIEALRTPLELASGPVRVGVSIGLAESVPGESADTLIGRADAAMYRAKQARKGLHAA